MVAINIRFDFSAWGDGPMHAGIIYSLYFTATECQDLTLRRTAISLLSSSPWREGHWNSDVIARLAEGKKKGSLAPESRDQDVGRTD